MVLSMERWVGRVAVVTGAGSGIGAAIVKRLISEGIKVVGLDRRDFTELSAIHNDRTKFFPIKTDTTKEEELISAFNWIEQHLGAIHILINNAGVFHLVPLTTEDTSKIRDTLETNLLGSTIATRLAFNNMKKHQTDGHIIYINSIFGHSVPQNFPNLNVYLATKYAITAIVETLRQELNLFNTKIKVTSISPGTVATEMTTLAKDMSEERREQLSSMPCLEPEDIADGVVYVLSTPPNVQVHELTIKPMGENI